MAQCQSAHQSQHISTYMTFAELPVLGCCYSASLEVADPLELSNISLATKYGNDIF